VGCLAVVFPLGGLRIEAIVPKPRCRDSGGLS
jgi:hypothetical protein